MSARPQLVVSLRSIPPSGIEKLREAGFQVKIWPEALPPTREELLHLVVGAYAIIATVDDFVDGEIMDAAGKQLRIVACYSVGTNQVVIPDATSHKVLVTNTPGWLTNTTADATMTGMLALVRKLIPAASDVQKGLWNCWEPEGYLGEELEDQITCGIVGFGRIGGKVAQRTALGFGIKTLFHDPYFNGAIPDHLIGHVERVESLPEMLQRSKIVTLHTDLSSETDNMVDREFLETMRGGYLVNYARGKLVVTADLVSSLDDGIIEGAAIDVTYPEPLRLGHPLLGRDNCITPHYASATVYARYGMSEMVALGIIAALHSTKPAACLNYDLAG